MSESRAHLEGHGDAKSAKVGLGDHRTYRRWSLVRLVTVRMLMSVPLMF